ncbi:MAG: hypothetical protein K2N81_06645 [Acetatifactor sp.]|nr:hypothetical protein [Acetatifactor sp.]
MIDKIKEHRFAVLCIIVAVSCICSVVCTYSIYSLDKPVSGMMNADDITVDGEDFTPIVGFFGLMMDGIVVTIVTVLCIMLISIGNILWFLIFWLIAIREASHVSVREISLTRRVIWGSLIATLMLAMILTKWNMVQIVLLLFWQMPLLANLFCVLGLKSRYREIQEQEQGLR